MSAFNIINDDWTDYEIRKGNATERNFVNCEDSWELYYLIKKIRRFYPYINTDELKMAIMDSCRQISKPRPRVLFVQSVLRKFGIM
jgi:hypothetical protein